MRHRKALAETLVELADTLVEDFDVVDLLQTLVERTAELLRATEAGLMLTDQRGTLRVMASTTDRGRMLELFELQNQEGPCLDCYRTGQPILNETLAGEGSRWPRFAEEARAAGFVSAYALPMRLRSEVIGALNLFRQEPTPLSADDVAAGQALAAVATIAILQQQALREAWVLAEQLQRALNSRVVIEQAKGIVAARGNLEIDESFALMRRHARSHNQRLHDTAAAVIAGTLPFSELAGGAAPPREG